MPYTSLEKRWNVEMFEASRELTFAFHYVVRPGHTKVLENGRLKDG